MGVLLRLSSMRKCRSTLRSPDISDTGTLSRPNDSVPVQMGLAMVLLRGAAFEAQAELARVVHGARAGGQVVWRYQLAVLVPQGAVVLGDHPGKRAGFAAALPVATLMCTGCAASADGRFVCARGPMTGRDRACPASLRYRCTDTCSVHGDYFGNLAGMKGDTGSLAGNVSSSASSWFSLSC